MVVGAREPLYPSFASQFLAAAAGSGSCSAPFPWTCSQASSPRPGGQTGAARVCRLDRLIQQSVLRPPAVTAASQPDGDCALQVGSESRARSGAAHRIDACPESVRSWVLRASDEPLLGQDGGDGLPSRPTTVTAKLTANRSDSCRSAATPADEYEPSSCIDGWQRTALDGRVRVRSSLVTPPAWARVWPTNDEKRPVSNGQQR